MPRKPVAFRGDRPYAAESFTANQRAAGPSSAGAAGSARSAATPGPGRKPWASHPMTEHAGRPVTRPCGCLFRAFGMFEATTLCKIARSEAQSCERIDDASSALLRGRIVDAAVSDPRGAGLCHCGSMLKRCVTCTRTRSRPPSTAARRRLRCRWSHGRGTTSRHAAEIPRPRSRHPDPGGPGYCRRRAGSRSRVCVIATNRTWMTLSGCSRTSLRTATPSSGAPRRHGRGGRSAAGGGDSRELRRAAPGCFEGAKPLRVAAQPGRGPRTPGRPDGTCSGPDGTRTGAGWA